MCEGEREEHPFFTHPFFRPSNDAKLLIKEFEFTSGNSSKIRDFEVAFRSNNRLTNILTREKLNLPKHDVDDGESDMIGPNPPAHGPWMLDVASTGGLNDWVYKKLGNEHDYAPFKIETLACGLNFKDVQVALGRVEREATFAMGLEAAGRLTYINPNAKTTTKENFSIGDGN